MNRRLPNFANGEKYSGSCSVHDAYGYTGFAYHRIDPEITSRIIALSSHPLFGEPNCGITNSLDVFVDIEYGGSLLYILASLENLLLDHFHCRSTVILLLNTAGNVHHPPSGKMVSLTLEKMEKVKKKLRPRLPHLFNSLLDYQEFLCRGEIARN